MSSSVSTVQVVRWPFLIAWMNVEGAGIKHAVWRNWNNPFLVLLIWTISLSACGGLLGDVSGMSHRPYDFFAFACQYQVFINIQDLKVFFIKNGLTAIITYIAN